MHCVFSLRLEFVRSELFTLWYACTLYTHHPYRAAVHEAGYTEKLEELDQATNFLHENGILLHFDDSSLLSDLYFLDPQWLCSNLAKVITVQQKNPFQKKGKIRGDVCFLVYYAVIVGKGRQHSY